MEHEVLEVRVWEPLQAEKPDGRGAHQDICVEPKQPLKFIILHARNAMVANQLLMVWYTNTSKIYILLHGCNVFVVDPKMLVWGTKTWLKFMTLHGCNIFATEH